MEEEHIFKAKAYILKSCKWNECKFMTDCKIFNGYFSQSDIHTHCRKKYQGYAKGYLDAMNEFRTLKK